MFALPAICIYLLPGMLGNLFVRGNRWSLALVIPGALAVGLRIVFDGVVIGANAHERFGVAACPWFDALAAESSVVPYVLAVVLGFPSAWAAYWSSGPASLEMSDEDRRVGAILVASLSALFHAAMYLLRTNVSGSGVSGALIALVSILPEQARAGFVV